MEREGLKEGPDAKLDRICNAVEKKLREEKPKSLVGELLRLVNSLESFEGHNVSRLTVGWIDECRTPPSEE